MSYTKIDKNLVFEACEATLEYIRNYREKEMQEMQDGIIRKHANKRFFKKILSREDAHQSLLFEHDWSMAYYYARNAYEDQRLEVVKLKNLSFQATGDIYVSADMAYIFRGKV